MNIRYLCLVVFLALLTAAMGPAQEAKKKGKDFSGQSLRMRDFQGQNLEYAVFDDADLFLAVFKGAVLSGASFRNADLTSASFTGANMTGADLRGAKLDYTSLERANLTKANLEGLDFSKASLQGADLRGANLRNVKGFGDITGADFREADLRGAVLLGSKDYSNSAKFKGAKYDKHTRWPLGFNVEASGAVLTESPAEDSKGGGGSDDKKGPPDDGKLVVTNKPAGAPSEEIVKKVLETTFWGPPTQFTKQRYRYKKMTYAAPVERQVTAGFVIKTALTYPVAVVGDVMVDYPDGVTKTTAKNQNFAFFKNEMGEWMLNFLGDN